MNFLDKLERRFGALTIHNIAIYIVAGQVGIWLLSFGYVNSDGSNALLERMLFDSSLVLQGEIWRIFTFPLIPPFADPIFLIFAWYIFYMISSALESQWGAFRLNLYMIIGAILGMAAGFLLPGFPISNAIWGQTIFLAFAYLFPDFELRLFFILPVKVRWLGWIAWAYLALLFFSNPFWQTKVFLIASVSNYFLFFTKDILHTFQSKKRIANMKAEKDKFEAEAFHTCSVCGATDKAHLDRDFRYRDESCICEVCLEKEKTATQEEA